LDDHVSVFGDCAVNVNPNSDQLAEIAISSAESAKAFGIDPKVALLSYSSGTSGTGAEVEKVKAATEKAISLRPDLKIEGPIQYDAAVDPVVGKSKMPNSEVAGMANVLVFPDLNTGNNTYKAVQRETGALAMGPMLQGLNKPVNDLSRGCTVDDIFNTVVITAIQAQENI
jgi:phosphate acetyltransferase